MPVSRLVRLTLLLAAGLATVPVLAGEPLMLGRFSAGDTDGWKRATFDGIPASDYRIVTLDGRKALRGRCRDSAAVFGIERRIDLDETPVLNWSWRVERTYDDLDERQRGGDDFPARVYAVIDGGWLKWRTRALNYVWASRSPPGSAWPNPFRDQAMMVAVRSGRARAGEWVSERRNLRGDFRRHFGIDADHIDGVAVMTDCDNHGGRATAYYGDIYMTAD